MFLTRPDSATYPSVEPVHVVGNSGSALTLNASDPAGSIKAITLTADCAFTLTGAVTGQATRLELVLIQDATGGHTVSFTSVLWEGVAPTVATAAGAVTRILLTNYGGTAWYGDLVGKGYA